MEESGEVEIETDAEEVERVAGFVEVSMEAGDAADSQDCGGR